MRTHRNRLVEFNAQRRKANRQATSSSVLRFRYEDYPMGYFGVRHGLTPSQAWDANRLLAEKQREHRLTGFRYAMRIGGIVSAIKRGFVGDSAWGRSMLAKRGGQALVRHAPQHLREISQRGVMARQANAEMRRRYGKRYG
jgi:hypothetical protein